MHLDVSKTNIHGLTMFELAVFRVETLLKIGADAPDTLIDTVIDVLNYLSQLARRNGGNRLEDFMPKVSNLYHRTGFTGISKVSKSLCVERRKTSNKSKKVRSLERLDLSEHRRFQ